MVTIYIDWFLPAYKAGGPIQTIANLVAEREEGVQYRIVTSHKDWDGTRLDVVADRWLEWNPWTQVYYSSKGTNSSLMGGGDGTLYLNGMYSWPFTVKPLLFSTAQRIILSPRGMLHPGALSQKSLKKKGYLFLWKLLRLHQKVAFHATDQTEAAAIRNVFGKSVKIYEAANLPGKIQPVPVPQKKRGELHLLSLALVSPMKNILPVLEALKEVEQTIIYHIYGPLKDKAYWKNCEAVMASLPSNISVQYGGTLPPEEIKKVLAAAQVFILPSKSENFGHALYEALSAGRPVITSHQTPWNGLEAAFAGKNVMPEKKSEIRAAIRFFADMEEVELKTWSLGARSYAEKRLDPKKIREQYRKMFAKPVRKTLAKQP